MRREDVQKGLSVRLLGNYLDVPAGTLATVETVGVLDRTWGFTVRWRNLLSTPQRKHRYQCSLNLWESDLDLFEPVTENELVIELTPEPSRSVHKVFKSVAPRLQLNLPFDTD